MRGLEPKVLDQFDGIALRHPFCSWCHDMSRNSAEADSERSLGTILKHEVKDTVAKLGGGIGMFAGALFLSLFGLAFLFVTIVLGLVALGVPAWVSTLIVTVVLFAVAALLAFLGKKKFAAV